MDGSGALVVGVGFGTPPVGIVVDPGVDVDGFDCKVRLMLRPALVAA